MRDEDAARFAANLEAKKLGDLGKYGYTFDDLRQEARLGVWRAAEEIAKLDGAERDAAMVQAGRSAIIDVTRHDHGRSPAVREAKLAIRVEAPTEPAEGGGWENDPEGMFRATRALAGLPKKLEMLAWLCVGGYTGEEIADFLDRDRAIVSRLRQRLGALLDVLR